jgi:hypothetical protein
MVLSSPQPALLTRTPLLKRAHSIDCTPLQSNVTELMKQRGDLQISMGTNLSQIAGAIQQLGK